MTIKSTQHHARCYTLICQVTNQLSDATVGLHLVLVMVLSSRIRAKSSAQQQDRLLAVRS